MWYRYYSYFSSLQASGRSAVFYGAEDGDLEMVKLLIPGWNKPQLQRQGMTVQSETLPFFFLAELAY